MACTNSHWSQAVPVAVLVESELVASSKWFVRKFTAVKCHFLHFPVEVTRVPRFKRLNSLLCLLHNLQNCKQRETRKAQILPVSTLTCPLVQKKSLFRLAAFILSLQHLFSNCKDPSLLCPYIQLSTSTHMYALCWLPTLRPICQAGTLPTETSVGPFHYSGTVRQWWTLVGSQEPSFPQGPKPPSTTQVCAARHGGTTIGTHAKQRRKKRGELSGTSDCDPALLCGGD